MRALWGLVLIKLVILFSAFLLSAAVAGDRLNEYEQQVAATIVEESFCESDGDCVIVGDYCPIGCDIVVNISRKDEVLELLENIHSDCEYDCRNTKQPPICENNICKVIAP